MKMWNGEIIHGSQKGWDLSYTYNRILKELKKKKKATWVVLYYLAQSGLMLAIF